MAKTKKTPPAKAAAPAKPKRESASAKKGKGRRVRAVVLSVKECASHPWAEFSRALYDAWKLTTNTHNWCQQELFRRDTLGAVKTPDAVRVRGTKTNPSGFYPYGAAKTCTRCGRQLSEWTTTDPAFCACPGAPTTTMPWASGWAGSFNLMQDVLRAAHSEYLTHRFDVVVRFESRLLTHKFPTPLPVPAANWKLQYGAPGEIPVLSVPIPSLGRVQLRLTKRGDFRRQLADLRAISDGTALKGGLKIYRNKKKQVLVAIVGYFPKIGQPARTHVCTLHTDPSAMLVADIDGRPSWVLNADHLRRVGATAAATIREDKALYECYLQRVSEDAKREKRMDRAQRRMLRLSRKARVVKAADRMKTAICQIAAQVQRFCDRQKVARVFYDDKERSFIPVERFPWSTLKSQLAIKLDEIGIEFESRPEPTDDAAGAVPGTE